MNKYDCITLFRIVPANDGYHYVCKNAEGQHYSNRKENQDTPDDLIFETEELAQKYIDKHLNIFNATYHWKPEYINYRVGCIPTEVIKEVD